MGGWRTDGRTDERVKRERTDERVKRELTDERVKVIVMCRKFECCEDIHYKTQNADEGTDEGTDKGRRNGRTDGRMRG